ncbi:MAG: squalene synthase HpnC [Burkholderiales bacterium]
MPVDHYENFPVASWLLPARLRHPVSVIYRFARAADDFADEGDLPDAERLRRLAAFGAELDRIARGATPETALFRALAPLVAEHGLPLTAFHDLLSAFSQDVTKKRYRDHADVMDYCRRSADPVGRLLLALYRAATPDNLRRADAVCSALQIINFLQDIAIDWRIGRVYLPQDEMAGYGITEAQIAAGDTGGRWREFMAVQVSRARAMLMAGAPLGRVLPGRIGLELRTIVAGGARILEKIEAADYDVFRRRPMLRAWDWPLLLARAFFK